MQGIWIDGRRPKSKKEVREALASTPESVRFEATSFFGNEYDGVAVLMPSHLAVHFVGPDPHSKRNFWGTASRVSGKWTVK